MSQEQESHDGRPVSAPDQAREPVGTPGSTGPEGRRNTQPPRPAMAATAPAPIDVQVPPNGPVKVSRVLWLMSFLVGLGAAVLSFFNRDAQLERLRQSVAAVDAEQDAETLDTVASIAFWGSLGAVVLVIVIEAALLSVLLRRRGWARWALLVMLIIQFGVMLVAAAFLAAPGAEGMYFVLLLAAQAVLAGAALVFSLLPRAGAWFRDGAGGSRRT